MKVQRLIKENRFEPIELKITIESEEELKGLYLRVDQHYQDLLKIYNDATLSASGISSEKPHSTELRDLLYDLKEEMKSKVRNENNKTRNTRAI